MHFKYFYFCQQTRDSGDYARLAAEVRQLRDDESQLRQENLQLKVNKHSNKLNTHQSYSYYDINGHSVFSFYSYDRNKCSDYE